MDYATQAGEVRRDDGRQENPSWTIGFEKSSHFGGKKKPGGASRTGARDSTGVRRSGSGDGKQRNILFVQAVFHRSRLGLPGVVRRQRSLWAGIAHRQALIKFPHQQ
jgi:hypothetical protein